MNKGVMGLPPSPTKIKPDDVRKLVSPSVEMVHIITYPMFRDALSALGIGDYALRVALSPFQVSFSLIPLAAIIPVAAAPTMPLDTPAPSPPTHRLSRLVFSFLSVLTLMA